METGVISSEALGVDIPSVADVSEAVGVLETACISEKVDAPESVGLFEIVDVAAIAVGISVGNTVERITASF